MCWWQIYFLDKLLLRNKVFNILSTKYVFYDVSVTNQSNKRYVKGLLGCIYLASLFRSVFWHCRLWSCGLLTLCSVLVWERLIARNEKICGWIHIPMSDLFSNDVPSGNFPKHSERFSRIMWVKHGNLLDYWRCIFLLWTRYNCIIIWYRVSIFYPTNISSWNSENVRMHK